MSDEVIVTDATIVERVAAGSRVRRVGMRLPEILLWTVISVFWYGLIRLVVVGIAGVFFARMGANADAAGAWLLFGTPLACFVAAFLTLQTNTRNRELHTVMTIVVLASAVVFHTNPDLGNQFVAGADAGVWVVAWLLQALAVAAGAGLSILAVRARRARRAQAQPALQSSL